MWYSWFNRSLFDNWHQQACAVFGIPHPGYNAATGQVAADAEWTTAYTKVVEVGPNDWRAFVETEVAQALSNGLGALSDPPPTPLLILPDN